MGALLGLASAFAFGVSDFMAGLAARRLHFLWVTLLGQTVGVLVAWPSTFWFGGSGPAPHAVLWGACSGIGSAIGTLALNRGYGRGEMAVVGPLSAIGAAAIPALVGVPLGDRLPLLGVCGVLLAFPAIWLMARAPGPDSGRLRTGVVDGLVSGAGFGLLFIGLSLAGDSSGLWPVAAGQTVAITLVGLYAVGAALPLPTTSSRPTWMAVLAGGLGISATVLYFQATHESLLTIAAVLTSVYPGVTVALAAVLLHERPTRGQRLGLAVGAVAVAAIVVG
jgi:drug/metabolite transporter (DMT)-like permease